MVEIKGKQYKAEPGSVLKIDRIGDEKGSTLEFDSVLMVSNDGKSKVGTPYLEGVTIKAVVQDHIRDKKVIIYKMKKRKNYRKKMGHRQQYSIILVKDIEGVN